MLAVCPSAAGQPHGGTSQGQSSLVRLSKDAFVRTARLLQHAERALDYGTFLWVEVQDHELSELADRGVSFDVRRKPFTLRLGGTSFEPPNGPQGLPAGWGPRDGVDPDLHLVQFAGPPRPDWLEALRDAGLDIVQHIQPFTYVVWGPAAQRRAAELHAAVRWTGHFAPGYRVLPQYRRPGDGAQDVAILLYRGADLDTAVRSLQKLGGRPGERRVLDARFEHMRWSVPGTALAAAAGVPGVYSIQPLPTDGGLRGEMSNQVCADNVDGGNLALPGYLDWLTDHGLSGAGVTIANVDSGIQNNHADLAARLLPCSGQTCGGGASTNHGTHTAAIMAGDAGSNAIDAFGFLRGLGVAPGASVIEQLFTPWYQQAGGMLLLMRESAANGASLSGNSWGPAGSPRGYDDHTLQVDIGVRDSDPQTPGDQPLLYVLSLMNGHGGVSSQGTPDEAKNILTVGSTWVQNEDGTQRPDINDLSENTAHGPCLDGRTIPHLVAPGCAVDSSKLGNVHGLLCGTSMASPHVSGAAALFIEYYRSLPDYTQDPSPALIKAALLVTARGLAGHLDADGNVMGHPFDSRQGWGRLNLQSAVDPPWGAVRYLDNPYVFDATGEQWIADFSPADPSQPMRIMLVWTDAPGHGLGGVTPAWNNDLDLVVQVDDQIYRGNGFGPDGWSAPGGTSDFQNNTEAVFLGPIPPAVATVRVIARDINSDGLPNSGDGTDQDFALVCHNCIEQPGFTISAAPEQRTVCVPDSATYDLELGSLLGFEDWVTLAGSGGPPTAVIEFSSNPVMPPATSVMTVHSSAVPAGAYDIQISGSAASLTRQVFVGLQVFDSLPTEPILLLPPQGADDVGLRPILEWSAAEQTLGYELLIAADPGFTQEVFSASGLSDTSHRVGVILDPGRVYYWRVRGANACGDGPPSATFSFRTRPTVPALLVDDDDDTPDVRPFYTDALDSLPLDLQIWDTGNGDEEPDAETLAEYAVVLWFTGDHWGGTCGPGPVAEGALASFLDAGGCLFISSQDYFYDRGLSPLITNYLGVSSVGNDVAHSSVTGSGAVFGGLGPYALSYPFVNWSDRLNPDPTAVAGFSGDQGPAAVVIDSTFYRSTFWGFPFEALPTAEDRLESMTAFVEWCHPPLAGDLNGDGLVDGFDLAELLGAWGPCSGCGADLSGDGTVNATDVAVLLANWS